MSSERPLLDRGIAIINEAATLDRAGHVRAAIDKYTEGVQFFLAQIRKEANDRVKETLRERANQYITRAETLRTALETNPAIDKPIERPARRAAPAPVQPPAAPATPTVQPPTPTAQPAATMQPPRPMLPQASFDQLTNDTLAPALQATVQITTKNLLGTGIVMTPDGFILTNLHVLGQDTDASIFIGMSADDHRSTRIFYRAKTVQVSAELDLALLKIDSLFNMKPLPADFRLDVMPIGNSDTIRIGDGMGVIGFPGVGGSTVTFTSGKVSGFLAQQGYIKTDALINHGNSGGPALDRNGRLVGVTTANALARNLDPGVRETDAGKLGLVRPINSAAAILATIPGGFLLPCQKGVN